MQTEDDGPRSAGMTTGEKIGWAGGGAGSTTMLYLVNAMLMYFMVTQLGIAPAIAGTILLGGRLYDGFADLTIGALSDRTRSRWGRRRPWMAAGTLLCMIGTAAVFLPPILPGQVAKHVQIIFALMLFFTGYSMFSVPSSAMPAEMTTRYDERTSLMSWRTFFLQVAGIVGGAGAPWMVARLGSDLPAYGIMASCAALFVGLSMGMAVIATRNVAGNVYVHHGLPPLDAVRSVLGNHPFLVLVGVKFCGFIALASMGAAGLFFIRDVLQRDESVMATIQLIASIVGIGALPVWRIVARHARKEHIFAVATSIYGLASASWLLASPAEPQWVLFARAFALGFGSTGSLLMALAMLPDAIEHDYHRTGLRREGVYAGIFEFFQKTAYAVAPFIVGVLLQLSGYVSSEGAVVKQSVEAIRWVRLTMGLLPVGAYALALALLCFYRLPPRDVQR